MAKAPTNGSGSEVIPDVVEGGGDAPGGNEELNESGLTAAEQAEFDAMRSEDGPAEPDPPADGDPAEGDPADGDPADGDPDPNEDADPAEGDGERTPAAADGKSREQPKTVSYGKYRREVHASNKRAKEAQEARQKIEADNIRLAERVRLINEALAVQPPAPPQEENQAPANPMMEDDVDPTVDYAGAVSQLNRRNRFLYESQQHNSEISQADQEDRTIRDTFTRDATNYASTEEGKHFPEAYAYLKDLRLRQIGVSEFHKDPADPQAQWSEAEVNRMVAIFNNEEKWLVGNAIKQRRSPSAAIMKQAELVGYKPQEAAAATPPARTNGAAPGKAPVAPPAASGRNVTAELAALAKNRDDGKSLSDGGSAPANGISVESILQMGDDEFADYVDRLPPGKLDALMGR